VHVGSAPTLRPSAAGMPRRTPDGCANGRPKPASTRSRCRFGWRRWPRTSVSSPLKRRRRASPIRGSTRWRERSWPRRRREPPPCSSRQTSVAGTTNACRELVWRSSALPRRRAGRALHRATANGGGLSTPAALARPHHLDRCRRPRRRRCLPAGQDAGRAGKHAGHPTTARPAAHAGLPRAVGLAGHPEPASPRNPRRPLRVTRRRRALAQGTAGAKGRDQPRQDRVVWAAGHNVLFRSVDGGRTWHEEHPSGLPSRDLHGFASDPRQANTLYAAVARHGLYRSRDGGRSYAEVTSEVGGNVFGLAVLASGRLLAADAEVGLLASDYGGQRWHRVLAPPVVGVAVDPEQPRTVLASGRGIFRSRDGGMHWRRVFVPPEGVGGDPDPSAPPRAWETDRGSGPWREPPERGFPPIRPLPSVTPFQSVRRRAYTAMSRYSAF
jgi:hypothetical protein